jgi:hypothetical protein
VSLPLCLSVCVPVSIRLCSSPCPSVSLSTCVPVPVRLCPFLSVCIPVRLCPHPCPFMSPSLSICVLFPVRIRVRVVSVPLVKFYHAYFQRTSSATDNFQRLFIAR